MVVKRKSLSYGDVRMLLILQKNSLGLLLYLADTLAYLPYNTMEEPLFVIHHVDMTISIVGSNLLQQFKEVCALCTCLCLLVCKGDKSSLPLPRLCVRTYIPMTYIRRYSHLCTSGNDSSFSCFLQVMGRGYSGATDEVDLESLCKCALGDFTLVSVQRLWFSIQA